MEFNLVVNNQSLKKHNDLLPRLFGKEDELELIPDDWSMLDLLVHLGMFRSKSDARRTWKRTGFDVPAGFTDLTGVGKLNHRLTIWNPVDTE